MKKLAKYSFFTLCLLFSINAFSQPSCILNNSVHFNGNENDKKNAIAIVDQSLKTYGNFSARENLSSGLRELVKANNEIKIIDNGNDYHVLIYPKNGSFGHDYSLYVNKTTLRIKNTVVANTIHVVLEDDFDD